MLVGNTRRRIIVPLMLFMVCAEALMAEPLSLELEWTRGDQGEAIQSLTYCAGGNLLAIKSERIIKTWDASSFNLKTAFPLEYVKEGGETVAYWTASPDGKLLIAGGSKGSLAAFDLATGFRIKSWSSGFATEAIVFSPDGKSFATMATDDARVNFWKTGDFSQYWGESFPEGPVQYLAYSPDGKKMATLHKTGVALREPDKGALVKFIEGSAYSVVFSPDSSLLAVARAKDVAILKSTSGEVSRSLELRAYSLAFSQDSKSLASAASIEKESVSDSTTRIWNIASGEAEASFRGYGIVRLSPDGKRLVSYVPGSEELGLWDTTSSSLIAKLPNSAGRLLGSFFSSDGKRFFAATKGGVKAWDGVTGAYQEDVSVRGNNLILELIDSLDGSTIASLDGDGHIRFWETASGRLLSTVEDKEASHIAYSPDGKFLAASVKEGISIYDIAARAWISAFKSPKGGYGRIAYSPDGTRIAAASVATTSAFILNAATGKTLKTLNGHKKGVSSLAFSPDGKRIASGDMEGMIIVWNVDKGNALAALDDPGYRREVRTLAFSPDGKRVASGTVFDNFGTGTAYVRLWDPASRKMLARHPYGSKVFSLDFSPDGSLLTAAGMETALTLWSGVDGSELLSLPNTKGLTALSFASGGSKLVTAIYDVGLVSWRVVGGAARP
jgi:WD40 repeat protein